MQFANKHDSNWQHFYFKNVLKGQKLSLVFFMAKGLEGHINAMQPNFKWKNQNSAYSTNLM